MPYAHLAGESNEARNTRLASEYQDYIAEMKELNVEPTNYSNWLSSLKHTETNGSERTDR